MLKRRTLGHYHKNTLIARIGRAMIRDDTIDRFPDEGYDLVTAGGLVHLTRDDLFKRSRDVAKKYNLSTPVLTRWWREASIRIYGESRRWPGPKGAAHDLEQYNPLDISETYDIITDENFNPSRVLLDGWILNRQLTRRERRAYEQMEKEVKELIDEVFDAGDETSDLEHVQA